MTSARPLARLGFLTIGLFDEHDPRAGHESTLRLIELGEDLGLDSAWLRHRHLQHGISSPVAVLAAASQRTSRIELGTAVTPLGLENPFRLAEDLATVDVLSGGRLNPGVSVGVPTHFDDLKHHLYPDTWEHEDFGYPRVERLLHNLRGEPVSTFVVTEGIETYSERVQPYSPGLAERVWYGGAGLRSAQWAGQQGLNLLTSSVVRAEEDDDFARVQRSHIDAFRAQHPLGDAARVSQGLVVIPTDGASPERARRYEEYAAAGCRAPASRRARVGSCSRPTSSAPASRSPSSCGPTSGSRPSTRSPSRCRSPSGTTTTCRSSPTWPRASVRCSAGRRRDRAGAQASSRWGSVGSGWARSS